MLKLLDIEDDLSLFGILKENHNILAVLENGKSVKEGCTVNVYRPPQVFTAISMEKGCKNHRETLYSSKGEIVYVVWKPCNIYRLRGNPILS